MQEERYNLEYMTSEEILAAKDRVVRKFTKLNEFLKSGIFQKMIKKYMPMRGAILEFGSSTGESLKILKEMGYENLRASDIDDYLTNDEFRSGFLRIDLNKEGVPLANGSLDGVSAIQVLEHLENPFHFARECCRLLKTNGILIISMPHGHNILDKIKFFISGNVWAYRPNNNHITFFLKDVFTKVFRDFELLEEHFGRPWIPWLRPRRWNKLLPRCRFLGYNALYVLRKK